jgi:subtilisin family serine protease
MKSVQFIPVLFLAGAVAACADNATEPDQAGPRFAVTDGPAQMVVFKGNGVPASFKSAVEAMGGTVDISIDAIGIASVSGVPAAELAKLSGVGSVVPDEVWTLDAIQGDVEQVEVGIASAAQPQTAFFYPRQWHLRAIGADQAWAAGRLGSPNVRVAILDTGIDYTHPDLVGKVDFAASKSFVKATDDPYIAAFWPGEPEWIDLHYHGTHVAATVSSNASAAAGVTSGVSLIAVKVLSVFGNGSTSGVLAGIVHAADVGADVINMSLGSTFFKRDFPGFISNINRAVNYAKSKGSLLVVSAGNAAADLDHDGNSYKAYCSAPNVVCVSATAPTASAGTNGPWTNVDALASYSNFGRSAIDVAAPGGGTFGFVTAACNGFSLQIPVCQTGTFVLGMSGTSMASPHVAALAALVAEDTGRNPAKIRAALQKGADDLGQPGTDPIYGKGRINVAKTLGL